MESNELAPSWPHRVRRRRPPPRGPRRGPVSTVCLRPLAPLCMVARRRLHGRRRVGWDSSGVVTDRGRLPIGPCAVCASRRALVARRRPRRRRRPPGLRRRLALPWQERTCGDGASAGVLPAMGERRRPQHLGRLSAGSLGVVPLRPPPDAGRVRQSRAPPPCGRKGPCLTRIGGAV